jgi:hypothetical protein
VTTSIDHRHATGTWLLAGCCVLGSAVWAGERLPGELPITLGRPLIDPQQMPTVRDIMDAVARPDPEPVLLFLLYGDAHNHYAPAWSGTGESLVFLRSDLEERTCKVCVFGTLSQTVPETIYDDKLTFEHMPAWDASGLPRLAFSSNNSPTFAENIHLWSARERPAAMTNEDGSTVLPSLRSQGDSLLLLYRHEGAIKEASVPWRRGGDVTTTSRGPAAEAAYAPDGNRSAMIREDAILGGRLLLHDVSTRAEIPLADRPNEYLRNPVWSPDGRSLAFFSRPQLEKTWTLWTIEARPGAVPAKLADGVRVQEDFRHVGPAWGPGSDKVWFLRAEGRQGYYSLHWATRDGTRSGVVDYPAEITTATDVAACRNPRYPSLSFVAVADRSLDLYVLVLNHP